MSPSAPSRSSSPSPIQRCAIHSITSFQAPTTSLKADGLSAALVMQVACVIPGGADADQVAQNQEYVDTMVPKGVWRALKEADLVRSDAPMPGDAEGRL